MNDSEQAWKHHTEEDTLDDFRGKLVTYHIRVGECRTTVRLTCTTWRLQALHHVVAERYPPSLGCVEGLEGLVEGGIVVAVWRLHLG